MSFELLLKLVSKFVGKKGTKSARMRKRVRQNEIKSEIVKNKSPKGIKRSAVPLPCYKCKWQSWV